MFQKLYEGRWDLSIPVLPMKHFYRFSPTDLLRQIDASAVGRAEVDVGTKVSDADAVGHGALG